MTTSIEEQQEPRTAQGFLGIGHPNIILQKDYRDDLSKGWCVRVETTVPVGNEKQIRDWLDQYEKDHDFDPAPLVQSVLDQVPADIDPVSVRHMIAGAFGYELGQDNRTLGVPRERL
jgi:hypothetical protein